MEVDSSPKHSSISKAEDGQNSQFSEAKTLNDVSVSSIHSSPGSQSSTTTSSVAPDASNESLRGVLPKSQEGSCKIKLNSEDSPCERVASESLQNHSNEEEKQAASFGAESQLSAKEEGTNHINSNPPRNASHNEIRQGSEPVQQVIIPAESLDKDHQTQVKINGHGCSLQSSLMPQIEPERKVEEIQSIPPAFKIPGDLNGSLGKDDESVCTKMNGINSDSSDEEEFLGLKRKVRGVCLSPVDLDSIMSYKLLSNETIKSIDQVQRSICDTKAEPLQTENGRNDGRIKPVRCDEDALVDVKQETRLAKDCQKNSLQNCNGHDQQEECVLSVSFSPNNENLKENGDLKEDESKPKNQKVKSVITNTLCSSDKTVNLPLANVASRITLASTPSPETIGKVLTEMGPPLPPVVLPLSETPPKFRKNLTPNRPSIHLPNCSSTEGPFSLRQPSKVPSPEPGIQNELKSSLSTVNTPSPLQGVPSPLQFGSATPKHAVPVPGRLPSSALNSSSPSASQETSMQMLDSMYPELSAQARTLNILRGNVTLGRAVNESVASPPSVNPVSGNKTINSSSTAFTKTDQKAKRVGANVLLPKSAKRLRLDTCSPDPTGLSLPVQHVSNGEPSSNASSSPADDLTAFDTRALIFGALEKLQNTCFDVLPVIRSHVILGRISQVPVLRDEEKSVLSDFCSSQSTAEDAMLAILSKIKTERAVMKHELLQAHCRVYAGLCRWRGDWQKAHALAYSLLKEDFPEAPKLILFMVTTWPSILSHCNPLCQAITLVSKLKAEGEILEFLGKYLHWEERPPADIHEMISDILKTLLEDGTMIFLKHNRHGHDLCPAAWEYIFSLDLLCSHLGWKWTHDNIIGKELWPVMNTWVTQTRPLQTPVRDVCVATVLRLIGRLGQLGLKEKLCMSVQNIAKAINLFGKHGISEGVPWEVQLSAVYTIYDLAPSNPKEALEALASWRGEITQPVPPAVTSCITQIGSICRQI